MSPQSIGKSSPSRVIEEPGVITQQTCRHGIVNKHKCVICGFKLAKFGLITDTGNISTFMKVVYVDETRSSKPQS